MSIINAENKEKGMTLVEIVAVIVLIGLIMGVIAPKIFGKGDAAKAQLNKVRMESIRQALGQYRLQFNIYPDKLEDLVRQSSKLRDSDQLFTPLLDDKELNDIWGAPYTYKSENNNRSYKLMCLGSDGIAGGEGSAQDLTMQP